MYAGGLFKVEVRVPPRYPFEPPACRLVTRIHHPNIDASGLICLDTLKMPPSGSWNPSSNLCTVLQTIQQLMGEPNEADGLSAEVAKQYRDHRAAFDLQARAMTRQFAMTQEKTAEAAAATTTTPVGESLACDAPTTVTPTPTPAAAPPAAATAAPMDTATPIATTAENANKRRAEDEPTGAAAEDQPATKKSKLEDGTPAPAVPTADESNQDETTRTPTGTAH